MIVFLPKIVLAFCLICLISATDYPPDQTTTIRPPTPITTRPPPPITTTKPTCGPNQIFTKFDNHPCRDTCDNPNLSLACTYKPGKYPGCICVDGFVKDNNGCTEREKCDIPCDDPNAEIVDYPIRCPDSGTCDNPKITFCKRLSPRKGCQCKEGYLKNKKGKCVLPPDCDSSPYIKRGTLPEPNKCPTPKPTCGKNEFYTDYAPVFPKACDNLKKVLCKSVKPGCACIPGYIRQSSAQGSMCIKPCDCPPCDK